MKNIYCQCCGKELTYTGGEVGMDNRAYCTDKEIYVTRGNRVTNHSSDGKLVITFIKTPKELQESIFSKELKFYTKL